MRNNPAAKHAVETGSRGIPVQDWERLIGRSTCGAFNGNRCVHLCVVIGITLRLKGELVIMDYPVRPTARNLTDSHYRSRIFLRLSEWRQV
jgi:hypothetical protein